MNTSLFLSTNVYTSIEPPPISIIKKEVDIKDKHLIKIKIQCSPNRKTYETHELKMGNFEPALPE